MGRPWAAPGPLLGVKEASLHNLPMLLSSPQFVWEPSRQEVPHLLNA